MDYFLVDDDLVPYVVLAFDWGERTPDGRVLQDVIKDLPGRRWSPGDKAWHITGTGVETHPNEVLKSFGVDELEELDDWWAPVIEPSDTGQWHIYPRFTGYPAVLKAIGPGAMWDGANERFTVDATDLSPAEGFRLPGFEDLPAELVEEAEAMRTPEVFYGTSEVELIEALAESLGAQDLIDQAVGAFGPVPGQFGDAKHQPYDFQVTSAYALAHGRYCNCHSMGSGKTAVTLLAATLIGAQRLLVIVPPVVSTNWVRELNTWSSRYFESLAPDQEPAKGKSGDSGPWVRRVVAGRQLPDLDGFEAGALIVPDSLVKRDDVRDLIEDFAADTLIVDEAHRFRTWDSQRSMAVRAVARTLPVGRRFALTGTPMLAHPGEMANLLAITGQLETEFGSYGAFMGRYTRINPWGKVEPLRKKLPELGRRMDGLWVMKSKAELMPHLLGKTHDWRYLDIDLKDYRAAFAEVIETIIERFGGEDELAGASSAKLQDFIDASGLGLISPMRRAAGLSKTTEAVEFVTQLHAEDDSPIVVFAHHTDVVATIADELEDAGLTVDVIDGVTSADIRGTIVDDFQDRRIDVLVASIVAAGVGINLTASHRVVFAEQSYTPGENSQAADRADRNGQSELVEVTYLLAAGTVDEQVQNVLATKIDDLESLGAADEAGAAIADERITMSTVIESVVHAGHKEAKRRVKKTTEAAA